jgi:hypothetical protein
MVDVVAYLTLSDTRIASEVWEGIVVSKYGSKLVQLMAPTTVKKSEKGRRNCLC